MASQLVLPVATPAAVDEDVAARDELLVEADDPSRPDEHPAATATTPTPPSNARARRRSTSVPRS
jgi:hypothetical protein